jgi:hypothetical protein
MKHNDSPSIESGDTLSDESPRQLLPTDLAEQRSTADGGADDAY